MGRLRKHVDHPGLLTDKAMVMHQATNVSGEGGRVTGHIHQPLHAGCRQRVQTFRRTGTGRVEQGNIEMLPRPLPIRSCLEEIRHLGRDLRVQAVAPGIGIRACHQRRITFHRMHQRAPTGHGQREITQTGKQF